MGMLVEIIDGDGLRITVHLVSRRCGFTFDVRVANADANADAPEHSSHAFGSRDARRCRRTHAADRQGVAIDKDTRSAPPPPGAGVGVSVVRACAADA